MDYHLEYISSDTFSQIASGYATLQGPLFEVAVHQQELFVEQIKLNTHLIFDTEDGYSNYANTFYFLALCMTTERIQRIADKEAFITGEFMSEPPLTGYRLVLRLLPGSEVQFTRVGLCAVMNMNLSRRGNRTDVTPLSSYAA